MKRHVATIAFVVALAAASVAAAAQDASLVTQGEEKPGIIRGRVTAAATGRALRRVQIVLTPAATAPGLRPARPVLGTTNAVGEFELQPVPPGSYYVRASRAGYVELSYGVDRPGDRGVAVDVVKGATVSRIDFALPRAGALGGRITDETGDPYPGVRIDVLAMRYTRGRRQQSILGGATTDDIGQFRISLPPGSYYVVATSNETWRAAKNETWGYAPTYYPGGPREQAQLVSLAASQERTDLHFSLHASRTTRIRGRVVRETGEPAGNANVGLNYTYAGDSIVVAGSRSVRTTADGSFEFKDVPPGTYSVGGGSAFEIVTVAGDDVEGLVLVSKRGSTVSGAVVTDEDTVPPFPSSGVRVLLDAPLDNVLPTVRVVSVEPDFSFKLQGLGGPFVFRMMGLPDDWMLASVRLGDKDITDTPWDVPTGGKELSGLTITITRKIGRISGLVTDSRGQPTSAATVLVFPDDEELWIPLSRLVKTARPTMDGRFSMRDLPAGTYRAVALAELEPGQWDDREFLSSVRESAQRVVLGEGGSETITLRLASR